MARGVPIDIPPEALERARVAYETTSQPLAALAADIGVTHSAIRGRAQRLGWIRYRPVAVPRFPSPAPTAATATGEAAAPTQQAIPFEPQTRGSIRERLQALVQLELDSVERVQREHGGQTDYTSRTMAAIARISRELNMLDDNPDGADADDIPRDIDEFRRALAQRIQAFAADGEQGGVSAESATGLDEEAGG